MQSYRGWIVLGDFNEWTRGLASRLFASHLESIDHRHQRRRTKTYPGVMPLLHLDHIYFDPLLQLKRFLLHRSRTALVASDHVPLVADFVLPRKSEEAQVQRVVPRMTIERKKRGSQREETAP